ncbi:MAG: hypothetical protein WAK93_17760 [Solirubrobacteraceae bacterium]
MSELPTTTNSTDEPAVGAALPKSAETSRRRSGRSVSFPHASRFRTATAILVGLGIAAVLIATAVAVTGRQDNSSVPWSQWRPSDSGNQGAQDIAEYLAPFYRISPVTQLAVVTVVNLESQTAAAAAEQAAADGTSSSATNTGLQVAVRPSSTSSKISLLGGNTIAYNLCGIGGKGCAIGVGKPSTNQLLLLRREALELALYTFKYIGGTQNVLAILPPGDEQTTGTLSKKLPSSSPSKSSKSLDIAVLFVRQELQPLLDQPLAATLPEQTPPTVANMAAAPEAGLVDQVTARGLFSEQLQQAQDGSRLIVLDPLPPQ